MVKAWSLPSEDGDTPRGRIKDLFGGLGGFDNNENQQAVSSFTQFIQQAIDFKKKEEEVKAKSSHILGSFMVEKFKNYGIKD